MRRYGMVILLCGGGSGGHITPLLAVANQLKKHYPSVRLIYIGEKSSQFAHLISKSNLFEHAYYISAGKFRRYKGQNIITRILDFKTIILNARDVLRTAAGLISSRRILRQVKPNVVFIKGGFVAVPVGLACALAKLPFITHDSDVLPGLANRIIGRWAALHTTGFPAELYPYPKNKTEFVGIPLSEKYHKVSPEQQIEAKKKINVSKESILLLVTGGSLGAKRLNLALEEIAPKLLAKFNNLIIVHQTGSSSEHLYSKIDQNLKNRLIIGQFFENLYLYSAAADLILARAGATTVAELAVQSKPAVLVPNPELTGGHQTQNAKYLAKINGAKILTEADLKNDPHLLEITLSELLASNTARSQLAQNLTKLSHQNSANDLAKILASNIKDEIHEAV